MPHSFLITIAGGLRVSFYVSGPNMYFAFGSDFVNERINSSLYWSFCMTALAERLGVEFGPSGFIRIWKVMNKLNLLDQNIVNGLWFYVKTVPQIR